MSQNDLSLHQLRLLLRRAAYRKERREARYNHWLQHGEGQRFCYVYLPKYPKELLEVYDWRPVMLVDAETLESNATKDQARESAAKRKAVEATEEHLNERNT